MQGNSVRLSLWRICRKRRPSQAPLMAKLRQPPVMEEAGVEVEVGEAEAAVMTIPIMR